jgi:hypothetical protein
MGHVSTPEPSLAGRRGPEPRNTWQHVVAHPAPCLGLMPVCGSTWSAGYGTRVRQGGPPLVAERGS